MSMFSDMLFEEYEMLDEGKQADEYRARKAKEKEDAASDGDRRYRKNSGSKQTSSSRTRFNTSGNTYDAPGDKWTKDNPERGIKHPIKTGKGINQDIKRQNKANQMVDDLNKRHVYSGGEETEKDIMRATDAANRHLRRHPKTESAIMLIEAYECDYIY